MRRRVGIRVVVGGLLALVVVAASCERGGGKVTKASANSPSSENAKRANPGGAADSQDERYRTEVRPESIASGQNREVELAVVPASGLKINREYPQWKLSLDPPEALEMEQTSFSSEAFTLDDSDARVSTALSAAEPGTYEISGTAGFSVCNDETCHIMRDERVSFRIHVSSNRDDPGGE